LIDGARARDAAIHFLQGDQIRVGLAQRLRDRVQTFQRCVFDIPGGKSHG
jgi:hypothetical protein